MSSNPNSEHVSGDSEKESKINNAGLSSSRSTEVPDQEEVVRQATTGVNKTGQTENDDSNGKEEKRRTTVGTSVKPQSPPPPPAAGVSSGNTEGTPPSTSMVSQFLSSQKAFDQLSLRDIFLWRNLLASFLVLVVVQATFTLLHKYEYSVLTLIGRIMQFQVLLFLLYVSFLKLKNQQSNEFPFGTFVLKEKDFSGVVKNVCEVFNTNFQKFVDLLMFKDWVSTLKFFGILQILCFLGNRVSGISILYMLALYHFSVPKFYEWKQKEIDMLWLQVTDHIKKQTVLLYEKIPQEHRAKLDHYLSPIIVSSTENKQKKE